MFLPMIAALVVMGNPAPEGDAGPFVRALWLVQAYGTATAVDPANDERAKGGIFKALGKDGGLDLTKLEKLMEPETFKKLTATPGRIGPDAIKHAVAASVPASRTRLLPKIREHAESLTTSFDMIGEAHRQAGKPLVEFIAERYKPGQPLDVIVICTGNSRRSILGATMGNIAADYYGMPEVRFHSGGTAPTAFNPRTVASLREIGVEIEPTGREAARGEPRTANPMYRVRWESGMETTEFSKHYGDPANPRQGFAALMVCGEADAGCPLVKGVALRVSLPYLDPKMFDDAPLESVKYAERRDDIGRLMLSILLQARQRLVAVGRSGERPQ